MSMKFLSSIHSLLSTIGSNLESPNSTRSATPPSRLKTLATQSRNSVSIQQRNSAGVYNGAAVNGEQHKEDSPPPAENADENSNSRSSRLPSASPSVAGQSDIESPSSAEFCDATSELPLRDELNSERKEKKTVRFPEDDSMLISDYFDAPIAFQKGSVETSTSCILASYVASCRRHKVPPSLKVQKEISNFVLEPCERVDCISLKGEKMSALHLECMEEIFRRVQFVTVDFEYTSLNDEAAYVLADLLEYYDSALRLNISFNPQISFAGWQAIFRMVRKSPCLEYLNLRFTTLNDHSIPLLVRALRSTTCLSTVHLENCALAGKSLLILVAALKTNRTVRELYLAENELGPNDAAHLYNLIVNTTTLSLLDLRNNNLQDNGLSHICDALRNQQCNAHAALATLVLWNNKLTQNGMPFLARALLDNRTITTLNLGCNNILSEGVEAFKDALTRNRTLLRLGLQGTKLNCQGAIAIAECLADNHVLIRVDLRDNADIRLAGLLALHLTLKINTSVITLNLDKTCMQASNAKVKEYSDQFRRIYEEIEELCQRNRQRYHERLEQQRVNEQPPTATTSDSASAGSAETGTEPVGEEAGFDVCLDEGRDEEDRIIVGSVLDELVLNVVGGEEERCESQISPIEFDDETDAVEAVEDVPQVSAMPRDFSFTCTESGDVVERICELAKPAMPNVLEVEEDEALERVVAAVDELDELLGSKTKAQPPPLLAARKGPPLPPLSVVVPTSVAVTRQVLSPSRRKFFVTEVSLPTDVPLVSRPCAQRAPIEEDVRKVVKDLVNFAVYECGAVDEQIVVSAPKLSSSVASVTLTANEPVVPLWLDASAPASAREPCGEEPELGGKETGDTVDEAVRETLKDLVNFCAFEVDGSETDRRRPLCRQRSNSSASSDKVQPQPAIQQYGSLRLARGAEFSRVDDRRASLRAQLAKRRLALRALAATKDDESEAVEQCVARMLDEIFCRETLAGAKGADES